LSDLPERFQLFNSQQTKQVTIVVEIDGVPGLLSSSPIVQPLVYGLAGADYGDPGLLYGGTVPLEIYKGGDVRSLLTFEGSSLTLSQKLEPEQGRGSVSTLTLSFVDLNSYMTELCSPGIIVDEILGRNVKVWLGYKELAFPRDYHVVFRGKISALTSEPGRMTLQLSDPNLGRRQQIFFVGKTNLDGSITNTDTTINVVSNGDFHEHILGPDGAYDQAVRLFLKVSDELIEYGPTYYRPTGTFGTNTFGNVLRGAEGTVAVAHAAGDEVTAYVILQDHAIDMALKLMLSGWDAPWVEDQALASIVFTGDPILGNQPEGYVLPVNTDANRDLGLVLGDYVTVTGATNPANNGTFTVIDFKDLGEESNRIIFLDNPSAVIEGTTSSVISIRSKYDTYPTSFGAKLTPPEVDIAGHEFLKETFLSADENEFRFDITSAQPAKTFIESEVYLPIACYSLTRQGRMSVGLTKPPIAQSELIFLNWNNIIDPKTIRPTRALNNRKFFNEIVWNFDYVDGNPTTTQRTLDTESLSLTGISSVLPISSRGSRTDLGVQPFIDRRTQFLLSRYKRGAVQISVKVTYEQAVAIEAGDVVAVEDNGQLQIANFDTGQRNLGTQLFEVVERTLDLKTGQGMLTLLAGVGASATDRFGTISPSSTIVAGSTTTELRIEDSYGDIFPGAEGQKWENYGGQRVIVHADDWSQEYERVLLGVDVSNPFLLRLDPSDPLPISPPAGWVVDIASYPLSPDPYQAQIYKSIHAFLSPSVEVVTGPSTTEFTVAPADIGLFSENRILLIHNEDYSILSPELRVTAVDTGLNKITVSASFGFTPAAGQLAELIGFADVGGAYRFI
jgi:hypothetical protein